MEPSEKEGAGGLPRAAEGAWPGPESGGAGGFDGTPEPAGAQVRMVKQEATDWDDAGRWVKLEVKEEEGLEPTVQEEKVKVKEEEATDWPEMKAVVKQEELVGQDIKQEEMVDGVRVKEEGVLKREEMDDEPPTNLPGRCKRKLALSRCESCGAEEAKYRCPRCMRYSCSLPCVKKHKAEVACNGVRDKTAYVSIQQFTEMNLLSDYRFLEDVARTADHISRDVFLKKPINNKHMYFLKNRARRQGINLKLLPTGFTKRKENSTFFDKRKINIPGPYPVKASMLEHPKPAWHFQMHIFLPPHSQLRTAMHNHEPLRPGKYTLMVLEDSRHTGGKQQFCWHVKLRFPQSQAEYTEKRVPDDKTINEILNPYIDPEKSDPVIRQRLKAYIHSQTGVQILMKVEHMQQNLVRYYELDPYKSLLENLRNKVIIEYPTLHVVLKGSSDDMEVLPPVKSESTKNLGKEN